MKRGGMLIEEGGKKLLAMEVFSTSIRYLKEEFEKEKEKQGKKVRDEEITWVLTVPAIWDEEAKQFMREAAEEVCRRNYRGNTPTPTPTHKCS